MPTTNKTLPTREKRPTGIRRQSRKGQHLTLRLFMAAIAPRVQEAIRPVTALGST